LGFAGRVPLHGIDTQPLRHINRQIFRHHQASAVLKKTEVKKTGVAHDTGRMVGFTGHNMCSSFWMVRTHRYNIIIVQFPKVHQADAREFYSI